MANKKLIKKKVISKTVSKSKPKIIDMSEWTSVCGSRRGLYSSVISVRTQTSNTGGLHDRLYIRMQRDVWEQLGSPLYADVFANKRDASKIMILATKTGYKMHIGKHSAGLQCKLPMGIELKSTQRRHDYDNPTIIDGALFLDLGELG